MAKILIPFSGGWNSTYVLFKALEDTTHEIVAPHYRQDEFIDQLGLPRTIADRAEAHAVAVSDWLRAQVRPFTMPIMTMGNTDENNQTIIVPNGDLDGRGGVSDNSPTHMLPLRAGFTQLDDYGFVLARYCQHARVALAHNCTEVWLGLDAENTHSDRHPYCTAAFKVIAPSVRMYVPNYIWNSAADENIEAPDGFTIGRFAQYAYLPSALRQLVHDTKAHKQFYDEEIVKSGEAVDLWDEWAEYIGAFGRFRDVANPASYSKLGRTEFPTDIRNYAKLLGRGQDHRTRPGIDRAREAQRYNDVRKRPNVESRGRP